MTPNQIKAPNADETALVESLRDFLKQCPYLPDLSKYINVEYLGGEEDSFMIQAVVADPIVTRYIDGSSIRKFTFYFSSREAYSMDVVENISSSQFYESFSEWLEACSNAKVLPELSGNRLCSFIKADTQGYMYDADNTKAQYMIQCTMQYVQGA